MRLSIQKYFPVVLTASFLLANLFNFATRRSEAQPITPEERIEQAWELARASGSYDYFSQVEQTSYPLPSLANTSREPQTDLMTLDGSVNFPEESMEMTLWQNGGGQLEDGLTIRVADGKTEARIGENEWQEIGHVADAFAPNADPLMFVDSAVNVEFAGSETRQVGDLTLTFDRYTFDLDGAVYANNMRRQAEERLQKYGTLPGGLEINTGEIYRNMEGSGELWLDPSGLPQRITIQTDIPPYRGSSRLVANIVTDFSDFDYDRIAAAQTPFIDQPAAWVALRQPELLETARQIASTIILTAAFGLVGLFFIRFYRHPKLYAWFAGLMVLGLIVPPLAHAEQARAFSENFHEDQIQQESRIAEANEIEAAKEDLRQADWNPHLEPGVQHSEVSNPSEIPLFQPSAITRQSAAINTTDSDDDGLIDTDEEYWGSCAYLVGTTEYNNEANCAGVTDPTDSDGDGLSDVTEVHDLGLMPAVADTDADGINDRLEVTGFVYNSQTWYLNPNEQDSNKDGIIDSAECLVWYDASPTFNESGVCPDSDGDGDPDIFDSDNDGDGVPDAEDLSMNVGGGQTFDDDNPFELTIDNLTIDQSVLVNLQLKPTNDNNLSLYSHVLDWPTNDTEGQITRYNDTTWANTSNGSIQSSADNAANGDIRLVPMLEITMPYDSGRYANLPVLDAAPNTRVLGQTVDTWLDQDELDPFSITINDVDTSTGDLVAFIPFTTVTDETDAIVAYSSQMLYRPGQGTGGVADWGSAHQFRFVWLVQMITDECVNADDDPDTCTRQDVMTVAHVYDESWQLTGLEVSEELGLSSALLYEDPTADDDLNFDDQLWTLSWNFSNTLMRGRDYINNTTGAQGSDGLRDVTVNNLDSSIDDWFGVDRYVNVVQQNYAHEAYMAHFVSTEGSNVLDTVFTPYASQTTPTLLYIHENESRTLNLDSIGGAVSASTTIDLDPASVKPEIISSMSWTPYSYTGGSWDGYDTESYLDLLAYRLETDSYFQPADSSSESEAIASGKVTWAQFYYASLLQGVTALTEVDAQTIWTESVGLPELDYDPLLPPGTSTGAGYIAAAYATIIVKSVYTKLITSENSLWKLLGENFATTGRDYTVSVNLQFKQTTYTIKVNVLTGLTLVAAAVGLSLVAAGYFSGNDTLFDIGVIILNIVTLVVTIVYAINMIQAMRLAVAGLQGLTAVKAALSAGRGMPALGVIGFAVGLGLTWGLFFFQMSGKSTIELNVMLAYAIAFTIILVVLLILDLIGFGLLTLIITIVDVILTLFGKTGVTQIIAEWLADLLYDVNLVIINLDDANRLDLDLGTVDLADPDAGFTVGNAITFNFEVTNTLRYSGKYNFDRADNTVFIYELERTERDYHDGLTFGQMDSEWQDLGNRYIQVHKDRDISLPLSTYGTGTNRAVNFYMTEAFAAQYEGCWFWDGWFGADGCTWEEIRQTTNIDLGSNMVYDVLPGTVSNFARMDWNSGSPPFPDQVDIDNDSLTDTDPYPTSVDGDGDGLTDLYEITNGLDPEAADGDGDGLNDAEELDYDTNPFLADSDGDLLNDRIEVVEGWLVPYNNGTQVARIWSDPNSQDADGDSLTDFDEFLFGFNPWVATDPSQIQNLVTFDNLGVNEVDGAELLLRFEETAAPANDLFVFDDSSGNGLEATCDNASGQCPLNGVDGRYGRALNFDGSDDQLNVAGVDITNRSFTISAWAQRENIGSASYILSQGTLQFNEGLQFGFLSNDRFLCSFYGSNQLISSAAYTDSDWHHWACTYDADTKRLELYRDGVNIGGTTTTVDYQGSGDLLIGQRFSATNYDFAGSIDEINIFDRAMTAGEIDDVMNGRYNPNDLLVAPGAELTYNATVTNTTSTNATGFLVPKTSYIEPEIGYPAVALGFEPEQKLTYFANEMGEQNQALCVDDGTCPTVGIDGALGSGVAFDGVDDVIQLPTVFNGNDFDTSANFGFWLWVDSLPTGTDVAMIFDSASTQDGALDLYLNAGGNIIYDIAGGEMVTSTYSFSGNLGRWVHVMINSNDLYINGDEPSKQSVFTSGVRVDQLGYGTMGNSIDGRSPLHGKIDELVYYDFTVEDGSGGGISYNEITTHVMTGDYYFNPDDLPNYLLKLEELNSYDGTIFYDSQANSNHATCSGNGCPILTDSTGGAVGRAATFDGVDDRLTQPGSYTTPGNNTNNEGETSLTLWVNIDQYPSAGNQAYILDSTSSGDVLDLYINSDGKFVASREEGTHTSSGAVPLNQWVKIHLYYDIFLESGNYHYNSFLEFDDVYDSDRNYRLGSSTHPWDVNLTIGPGYIGNDASNSSPFSGGLDEMSLSGLATIDFDPPSANLGFENLANTLRTATCDDIFVCPSEVTGQYGQAVGLDGDDDHLLLGEVDFAQGDYTIGVWFNSSASGASQTILAAVSETSNHGVLLELQSDGRLRYLHRFPSGTSGGSNIFSGSAYNDGAWHYATAVRQGSSMTLYVDGVEIGTATAAQNAPEALEVVIGQLAPTNDNRSFNGFIDELLIIPSAVTDAGVAHLMNSEFPVLNVPDLFTGFSAGPLSTLDVAGTASINEFTTASVHQFDLEVEAALELQTNIDYPVVDDNAANLDMFFPFEETPGSTQFDNLISTDEATCSDPACPTAGLRGQVGRALYFDGNDDFLTARLNATSVGYDTIAFWANGKNGTFLSISSVEIDFNRIKNSSTDDTVPLTLPIDEWFHIAIVDGSSNSVDIYLNGQWVDNQTIRFGGSGSGEIYLGANFDGQDQYNGFLDDLRFYDKSLTAAEVLTLYEESAPLMRLEFDEESDATVFLDNSVNGFVGVPDSTTYFDATLNQTVTRYSPLPGTDGKIGNTALFEADGFVEVAEASSAINLIDDFSIMLWLKTTETDVGLFGKTDGDSSWELGEKMFYLDSNGYPTFVGWGNNFIRSSTAVNDDVWHHIAVTWDAAAGTGTIVIDGVDATTGDNYAANNADNSGDTIKIGAPNYFSSEAPNFFSGEIDELAVYGRALPEAELFSIYLREYRWYRDHSDNIVIVDTDAPTIELLSDLGYRQNGYIQLAVATRDVTSRVTLLDFGLKGPGDSSFTWQGANVCAEAIATNAAWCPYVDTSVLDGAGEYEIQFRAVDAVGNETTSPVYTIYVDGEAPSTTSGTYNSAWLPLIPDPTQELSWTVFLAGTITDPVIPGGQDGSGPITRTTTLTLINAAGAIVGNGQPQPVNVTAATVSSFDWSVNYQFIGQRPTGVYTLTLQTEDAVGNQADLVIDTIRLDGRAPSATYNHWEMASNGITETVTLSGVVVEQPDWGSTVAEFHMESAWYDSSGEDNHASCTSCPTAVSGLFGAAADFAGTDALSVPAAESLNLEADLTIAAWINPDIAAGSVLTLGSDKAVLGLNASSQLYFTVTVDGTPRTITAPDGMGTGAWRHIAGTYDGVTMRLYQDGVELDTLAITGSVDASSGLTIGSAFDGRIDEIFVYGRALTAAEIYATGQREVRGVQAVELWIEEIFFDGSTDSENWQTAAVSGGEWTLDVPDGLEGFFDIHLRSRDLNGNQAYEGIIWRGSIDTADPRISFSGQHGGGGSAAYTEYTFDFADIVLDPGSFNHPCTPDTLEETVYTGTNTPLDGQLYQAGMTCRVAGHQTGTIPAGTCDFVGHCATETVSLSSPANLASVSILSPEPGRTMTLTQPISITGGAYAPAGIEDLIIRVDTSEVGAYAFGGSETDTGWSTSWWPTLPGTYTITAVMTDTLNSVYTDTIQVTLVGNLMFTTVDGSGIGTVNSDPTGISCGTACMATWPTGSVITLTAVPDISSHFAGWSGACSGTGSCVVTLNSTERVTATFDINEYDLTVTPVGDGSGTVNSSPAGIDCGVDCSETLTHGTVMTLTAVPDAGSIFNGWGGSCSGNDECVVTMLGSTAVTAEFLDDSNVGVSVTPVTLAVAEGGITDTYTIALNTNPTDPVTITLATDGQIEPIAPLVLTDTGPVTVTVTAVDDSLVEGNHLSTIAHSTASVDLYYDGITVQNIEIDVTDNDIEYALTAAITETAELDLGSSTPLTFTLSRTGDISRTSQVDFDLLGSSAALGIDFNNVRVSGTGIVENNGTITFTDGITQAMILLDVIGDDIDESDETIKIALSSPAGTNATGVGLLANSPTSITIIDDDSRGVLVLGAESGLTVSEGGMTDTYTIQLTSEPTATVTLEIGVDNGEVDLGAGAGQPISLTFTTADWMNPQTVTATAIDDLSAEPTHNSVLSHTVRGGDYGSLTPANIIVTILDDDVPNVTLTPPGLVITETGVTTATFVMTLDSLPTEPVTVTLTSDDVSECTVAPGVVVLTPANWNTGLPVTVTSVDENIDDADQLCTIVTSNASSSDADYSDLAVDDLPVTVIDDDGLPSINFATTAITTTEGSIDLLVTLGLSNPSAFTVTVDVDSANHGAEAGLDYTAVSETVSFTPLATTAAFIVPIMDDNIDEPTEMVTLTVSNPAMGIIGLLNEASVIIEDNDAPSVITVADSSASETDLVGSIAFTVSLNVASAYPISVSYQTADGTALAGQHYTETIGVLNFAPGETEKWVTVPIIGNDEDGPNQTFELVLSGPTNASIGDNTAVGTILDDDFTLVYLPIALQNYPLGPDLIVESLAVAGATIEVTIRNSGDAPVTDAFWVDVYVDPDVPPTAVNQTIDTLGSRGAVWGVSSSALPLMPGESLTLVLNDPYFDAAVSRLSLPVQPGSAVYAQVDSAHPDTSYGGVLESHERLDEPYNNIIQEISK